MIPSFDKVHNRFKLNGISFDRNGLNELAYSFIKEGEPYERVIGNFIADWLDSNDYVLSKTSGSTGKSKTIKIKKQAMVNSAIATGDYFRLKPSDKALLCLPAQAISGRMMLVRAMILGLELDAIKPSKTLNIDQEKRYTFTAFTPMQLANNVDKIKNIKTIIVGGAPVSYSLMENIKDSKVQIFETYGMTETVSHIAVKKLNGFKASKADSVFKVLPGINISKDDKDCLVIDAPNITSEKVVTNDIVRLTGEGCFEWLGRFDNVINSGGIKLNPEIIESKLQGLISDRFFVSSIPDEELGEKVVLVLENSKVNVDFSVFKVLDKYEAPKEVVAVPKFKETQSGKIQRHKTLELLK